MLSLIVLTALDSETRERALFHCQLDLPGAVAVRHEVTAIPDSEAGLIRRIVSDSDQVLQQRTTELEHSCLHCATRHDIVPTLRELAAIGRYDTCLLALPAAANPEPMLAELADAVAAGLDVRICAHVAVVDAATILDDVFGDAVLLERGLELSAADDRSVGETLCGQLEYADVVWTPDHPEPRPGALVDLLAAPDARRHWGLDDLSTTDLLHRRWSRRRAARRIHPVAAPSLTAGRDGIHTLELTSERPFHPDRLHAAVEVLGTGPVRSRGCFWLPTRPSAVCGWDCAGGQLSIGDVGRWHTEAPRTRVQWLSPDAELLDGISDAFAGCLVTDLELARDDWARRDDGFDPWLGIYDLRSA